MKALLVGLMLLAAGEASAASITITLTMSNNTTVSSVYDISDADATKMLSAYGSGTTQQKMDAAAARWATAVMSETLGRLRQDAARAVTGISMTKQ